MRTSPPKTQRAKGGFLDISGVANKADEEKLFLPFFSFSDSDSDKEDTPKLAMKGSSTKEIETEAAEALLELGVRELPKFIGVYILIKLFIDHKLLEKNQTVIVRGFCVCSKASINPQIKLNKLFTQYIVFSNFNAIA